MARVGSGVGGGAIAVGVAALAGSGVGALGAAVGEGATTLVGAVWV
jgi:hypothetical protein